MKYILLITALAAALFWGSAYSWAQEAPRSGINLTVSPVFLSLTTSPGKPVTSQFRVKNNNNEKETLQISIKKYVINASGSPVIADLETGDNLASWVQFSENTFTLDANQIKTISFTLTPPTDAALGYYYAFVIGRVKEASVEQGAAIAGAPAIPVLLSVDSPNAKKELQLVDFKTDKPFYEYLPVTFTVTAKNTGNIHLVPFGDIFIDQGGKKEIAILPANEGRGNILPGAVRTFEVSWGDGFATLKPKADAEGKPVKNSKGEQMYEVGYDFSKADKFRIGKYTAHLLMVYDNGERDIPLEAKVSFWVVPWKILIVFVLILLLALVGLRSIFVGFITNMRKKNTHGI